MNLSTSRLSFLTSTHTISSFPTETTGRTILFKYSPTPRVPVPFEMQSHGATTPTICQPAKPRGSENLETASVLTRSRTYLPDRLIT